MNKIINNRIELLELGLKHLTLTKEQIVSYKDTIYEWGLINPQKHR